MKVAHWSKVAKSLAVKYGLTWSDAKTAYKNLKTTAPRTPSLRMVSELPARLPKNLKGVRTKQAQTAKIEKAVKAANQKKTETPLPPNIVLAPKAEKPTPALIPTRQGARNRFEKALRAAGLPVAAIARSETGKVIVGLWRQPELQDKLIKLMVQGYKQIAKRGAMREQTIFRVEKVLQEMGIKPNSAMWNDTLRQLYGQKARK